MAKAPSQSNQAESNQDQVNPVAKANDPQAQAVLQAEGKDVNEQGERVDGRRPEESEKPRPAVNRPTLPEEAPQESVASDDGGQGELKDKSGMKYYRNDFYSAASVLVRDEDGDGVADEVRFVPYYDTYKGDQVRVGFLATDNKQAQETLKADPYAEEISFQDYKLALRGDGKRNQPLGRAPIPAST